MKQLKIGFVIDALSVIKPKKDSSFAIMLEAQKRDHEIYVMEQHDLMQEKNSVYANMQKLKVQDSSDWFINQGEEFCDLSQLDVVLMRKDPPVDRDYTYTTYLLEKAKSRVINNPRSIRNYNEKLFTLQFECSPFSLVSANKDKICSLFSKHKKLIIKGLDSLGGREVFLLDQTDLNHKPIIEKLTNYGKKLVLVQPFIEQILKEGDKRIILIDGYPIEHVLLRVPAKGDLRGNMVAGASVKLAKLSKRDHEICEEIGPVLRKEGLSFVGIDVIGDFCTEINVTSPTGIREIDKMANINISGMFLDFIEKGA